jgi:hypothetical protein
VPISAAWDERATESLKAEITASLRSKLKLDTNDSDAILHKILEKRDEKGERNEPIFVIFPQPTPPSEVLKELRKAFPTVTFFLLTGEQLPALDDADAGYFQPLAPGLPPGEELDAYIQYRTARSIT